MANNKPNKMKSLLAGLTSTPASPSPRNNREEKEKKIRKEVICVTLPAEINSKIRLLSKLHGVSISTVIEEAASLYITRYEEAYGEIHQSELPTLPKV